jgi:putative hemolysin
MVTSTVNVEEDTVSSLATIVIRYIPSLMRLGKSACPNSQFCGRMGGDLSHLVQEQGGALASG